MLKPEKYVKLENNIVYLGSIILSILREKSNIKYNELLFQLTSRVNDDVKFSYAETLSFLYLIGRINYNEIKDEINIIYEIK